MTLQQSIEDPNLYSASLDLTGYAPDTVIEWSGEIDNGCGTPYVINNMGQPYTFTRVSKTRFVEASYDFTVADGYNLIETVDGVPMHIQVQNDDTVAHSILLDVENPYEDLILGFVDSGSVDQVVQLEPGEQFNGQLRVFTQETTRDVYNLTLRLENELGEVDRIPLTIRIQEPVIDIGITVLEVDDRTLITRARLTNHGDDLTDLTLDIVNSAGIPANIIIQPDIQHTFLRAGQTIEIAFVPVDIHQYQQAPMSTQTYDPLTGAMMFDVQSTPQMVPVEGPFQVILNARNQSRDVALEGGELHNSCGQVPGSEFTMAAECVVPAGSDTRIVDGWYCTNNPDIDVPFSLALPNGGLDVPVNLVDVSANFSQGFTGERVYNHSTTLSLNSSIVGNAIVPNQSTIHNTLPPESLILGGAMSVQTLNLRSQHNNNSHYTIASGFTVTVEYGEHMSTGCFTEAEIQAAENANAPLICETGDVFFDVPQQRIDLELDVDLDQLTEAQLVDPYNFEIGETIPLVMSLSALGTANITDDVQVELTLPDGLYPQALQVPDKDTTFLEDLIAFWQSLFGNNPPEPQDDFDGFTVDFDQINGTLTYTFDRDIIRTEQFAINLDVTGQFEGDFTISGEATILDGTGSMAQMNMNMVQSANVTQSIDTQQSDLHASDTLDITVAQETVATPTPSPTLDPSIQCRTFVGSDNANIRSGPGTEYDVIGVAYPNTEFAVIGGNGWNGSSTWYFGEIIDRSNILQMGWLSFSPIQTIENQDCMLTLPAVGNTGSPQPTPTPTPPPPPTPESQCIGFTTNTDFTEIREINITVQRDDNQNVIGLQTNIVDPSLGSFGPTGTASYFVQVIGRYVGFVPQSEQWYDRTWDDWYRVSYQDQRDGQTYEAWVTAEQTTLFPSYNHNLCNMPLYVYDADADVEEIVQSDMISSFPSQPAPASQASQLYQYSTELRLPSPFTVLPIFDTAFEYGWTQGYGMNEFAFRNPNYYDETNHIHSGLDFGGLTENDYTGSTCLRYDLDAEGYHRCVRVRTICPSVVVSHNGSAGAGTGSGITFRCYTPEGSRSNIFVTYNHLYPYSSETLPALGTQYFAGIELRTRDGSVPIPVYQYGNAPNEAAPHLHIEMFYRDAEHNFRINPLLFFGADIGPQIQRLMYNYYPIDDSGEETYRLFEWPPPDTIDPSIRPNFADGANGYTEDQSLESNFQDFDLGIEPGELGAWTIVADMLPPADINILVWRRLDQGGIQDIDTEGPEFLDDTFIVLTLSELIEEILPNP